MVGLTADMAIVRLHDAWARYCRELVVSSAGERPTTASGIRLPLAPGIRCRRDVIPTLLATFRGPRYEPKWARAQKAIDAATRLHVANVQQIAAALGASNSPAEELRVVRNFLAHRGVDTARQVRALSVYSTRKLNWRLLAADHVGPGVTRFEDWVIRLEALAEAAIQ